MLIKNKTVWTPDNSALLKYRAAAESGDVLIGHELRMELDNLVEDMSSGEYEYDTTAAEERFDFMEGCLRLTKSPFYGKPMRLMLWQRAWIEALYSFKLPDGHDRFWKTLLMIARKNTKSETTSALTNSEFIVGPEGSDIVCSSNDDAQASIVYDAADTMRRMYDPDDLDTKHNQRFIMNKVNGSKIFKMSDRTRNKEGRNIDFAIVDEIHEMKDNVIVKSIEQSQSLKENPKLIEITTEGFVFDGFLDGELKLAREVINGEDTTLYGRRFLPWLYTQDSEQEVWIGNRENRLWEKSNPTLGLIKSWDFLEAQVDIARQSKADRIFTLSKDFNIKTNAAEAWLLPEDFTYPAEFDVDDFRGYFALGAVDLSQTTDMTSAKALVMAPGDDAKYILSHYFIPETKLTESDDADAGAKYKDWAAAGLVTICEGSDVDLAKVADWFYMLYEKHGIRLIRCGYDQKFAKEWISRMNFYNWTRESGELEMVIQNAFTLSNAIKLLEQDLKHRKVNYNENAVDRWCLENAALQVDRFGNALIVKQPNQPHKRIDGAVTFAIVYEMYRRYRSEFKQYVEQEEKNGMVQKPIK